MQVENNSALLKQFGQAPLATAVSFDKYYPHVNFQKKEVEAKEYIPTEPKTQESILGMYEKKPIRPVVTNQKTSKSGKNGKYQVQVIEQESELTKVKYDFDPTNQKAVFANGIGIIDDYMASENLNECVDALLVK